MVGINTPQQDGRKTYAPPIVMGMSEKAGDQPAKDRCISGASGGYGVCSTGSSGKAPEGALDRCISGSSGGHNVCSTGSSVKSSGAKKPSKSKGSGVALDRCISGASGGYGVCSTGSSNK